MSWIWSLCYTNLIRRKVRTALTILGVMIGVISVVSMIAIGIGMKQTMIEEVASGESMRLITVTGNENSKRKDKMITDQTIERLNSIPEVSYAYPVLSYNSQITYDNFTYYGDIIGLPIERLQNVELVSGEMIQSKGVKPELIAGAGADYMFYNRRNDISMREVDEHMLEKMSGKTVTISNDFDGLNKSKIKISGVSKEKNNAQISYGLYTDIECLKRYLKHNKENGLVLGQPVDANGKNFNEWIYQSAVVIVDDFNDMEKVEKKISDLGYRAESEREYIATMQRNLKLIQMMLGFIGMIALIVAVIGICNTMTTSVYDRVGEIGILKVLGCDPEELLFLFLLEAGIIGAIGGVTGVLTSYGIITLINQIGPKLLQFEKGTRLAQMPIYLALGAIVFSIVLGVLAGLFPARWAMKLKPIDAVIKAK